MSNIDLHSCKTYSGKTSKNSRMHSLFYLLSALLLKRPKLFFIIPSFSQTAKPSSYSPTIQTIFNRNPVFLQLMLYYRDRKSDFYILNYSNSDLPSYNSQASRFVYSAVRPRVQSNFTVMQRRQKTHKTRPD